jgi:hypothetical protein
MNKKPIIVPVQLTEGEATDSSSCPPLSVACEIKINGVQISVLNSADDRFLKTLFKEVLHVR